ncbi:MAG: outer membrane beta-barrel protein [Candidatus Aminicenantales bacterium]
MKQTIGPFHIRTSLVLNNAGYDSNIYYGATDEPVEDYTFTAGPAFDVYLPLMKNKVIFYVYESPQYVYYRETERERAWNNYFQGQAYFVFNRLVASAGIGRSEAKQRWNTEMDIPVFRKEDSIQGSLLWQPASRTSFDFAFRTARFDHGESDLEDFTYYEKLNREETYFSITAYRETSPRTRIFLNAESGIFDFADPSTMRNSKSYGGYGGFEFSPFGKIRGMVKIGYKYFDATSPERKDYRGIVGDSSISVRLSNVFAARAFYSRDVQFSVWYDNAYFLENRYGAGASLYIAKNIRLDYDYYQGRNEYPREPGIQYRRDDFRTHSVGVYLRLRKDVGLGVIASRWVRDSNLDWGDDERDFVGFNLTYDF